MSRSIYFFLLCLCASPIAAYSAEEAHKKYQITVDKLQCLYEHSERLLSRSEQSVTVRLSDHCEDIAIEVEDSGVTRGPTNKETLWEIKIASRQAASSDIINVLTLTREELECFREEYANLELENKVNRNEELSIHFAAASCKIQSTI
jgi:hypothetical protein